MSKCKAVLDSQKINKLRIKTKVEKANKKQTVETTKK
jgi:hypothetical protein